jgi:hypothetical protein
MKKRKIKYLVKKTCTCGVPLIFLPGNEGKFVPVEQKSLTEADWEEIGRGYKPGFRKAVHVNHFTTCTNYRDFHKQGKASNMFKTAPIKDNRYGDQENLDIENTEFPDTEFPGYDGYNS